MHEQSETIERDGKWLNVYGKNVAGKAGQPLPGEPTYSSLDAAVAGAKRRSASADAPPTGFTWAGAAAPVKSDLPPGFSLLEAKPMPEAPTTKPAPKPDDHSVLWGAVLDTLGLTDRPGAVPLTGRPGVKTPLGVVLNPEGVAEHLTQAAVVTPAIALGGAGLGALAESIPAIANVARFAPAAGRIATSGAVGGGEAAAQGRDVTMGTMLDAVVAGLSEGAAAALRFAPKVGVENVAEPLRAARRGLQWATEAPEKALDIIADRLPKGRWLNVPSLSDKAMTVKEAVKKLAQQTEETYRIARQEIASEMTRLDIQRLTGPKPTAGAIFKDVTAKKRWITEGTPFQRVADAVAPYLKDNALRSAWDALWLSEVSPGVPLGAVAGAAVAEAPGAVGRHIPGGRIIEHAVEATR